MATKLPKNYKPSKTEKFMNAKQKEYFRLKLKNWKNDIYQESRETVENLQDSIAPADVSDRATQESEKTLELKSRDRHRKLISKIDKALMRVKDKTFGFCAETAEPIGLKRLMARPVADLCIAAQEKHEKEEKVYADD